VGLPEVSGFRGGSIGSELSRQIATFNPQRLVLVDQSEVQTFPIEQELIELGYGGIVLPAVADIRDSDRMRFLFQRFKPAVVFHAAAHKHVPLMESQPNEAIRNNILGTARLAELAFEYGVDRFVMISTDKAINPTNVMGATKRLAEIFIQSLHASLNGQSASGESRAGILPASGSCTSDERTRGLASDPPLLPSAKPPMQLSANPIISASASAVTTDVSASARSSSDDQTGRLEACPTSGSTKFMAVRFGNVLGSSGSVIPIFNRQIAAGGPVKVTHPEVTRYFMTIPEAAGLVLQSAAQGNGGEIFVRLPYD